jgi:hypothetical protein
MMMLGTTRDAAHLLTIGRLRRTPNAARWHSTLLSFTAALFATRGAAHSSLTSRAVSDACRRRMNTGGRGGRVWSVALGTLDQTLAETKR